VRSAASSTTAAPIDGSPAEHVTLVVLMLHSAAIGCFCMVCCQGEGVLGSGSLPQLCSPVVLMQVQFALGHPLKSKTRSQWSQGSCRVLQGSGASQSPTSKRRRCKKDNVQTLAEPSFRIIKQLVGAEVNGFQDRTRSMSELNPVTSHLIQVL
jgi:hypothetical protein